MSTKQRWSWDKNKWKGFKISKIKSNNLLSNVGQNNAAELTL